MMVFIIIIIFRQLCQSGSEVLFRELSFLPLCVCAFEVTQARL